MKALFIALCLVAGAVQAAAAYLGMNMLTHYVEYHQPIQGVVVTALWVGGTFGALTWELTQLRKQWKL